MIVKTCKIHGPLTKEECYIHIRHKNGVRNIVCRLCSLENSEVRYSLHFEQICARIRTKYFDDKIAPFYHYSNGMLECARCGEDNVLCLALDHINNNGAEHRKLIGDNVYRWARLNNYPSIFQVVIIAIQ
jgi:hypothetical protein